MDSIKSIVYRTRSVVREEKKMSNNLVDNVDKYSTSDYSSGYESSDDDTNTFGGTTVLPKSDNYVDTDDENLVETDDECGNNNNLVNTDDECGNNNDLVDSNCPNKMNLILVFDVQKTGTLLNRETMHNIDIENSPYILQLSFVVFDIDKREVIAHYNSYIDIHDSVIITPNISSRTGIVKDMCNQGNSIEEVLFEFYHWYIRCNEIVSHNLNNDKEMIIIECVRNYERMEARNCQVSNLFSDIYNHRTNKSYYCTMLHGKKVCNILRVSNYNSSHKYQKYPTLTELHKALFAGPVPSGLDHTSVHTMVCLKCYLSLKLSKDVV